MASQDNISILWLEDEPRQVYSHIKRLEDVGFNLLICINVQEAINNGGRSCRKCLTINRKYGKLQGMPRLARLDAPGVLHHVMGRGIERREKFRSDILNGVKA
jgi:hypothetical protein